uniref:Uncharacterized protein n=1 Tax=Acrobeloides nanus TaxID=290746 RepID=A0A914D5J9_9BILA
MLQKAFNVIIVAGPTATTIPIPSPRNSKVDQIFYHDDSDLSEVDDNTTGTDKSSPFPVSTALQESNAKYENETANIDLN